MPRHEGVELGLAAATGTVDGNDDLASHGVRMILDATMATGFHALSLASRVLGHGQRGLA